MHADFEIRNAAFNWLAEKAMLYEEVFPRDVLANGFEFKGERIPLLGPQGIFKPRMMEFPLSITSTPKGPYDDTFNNDGFLSYRYRGTDIYHRDNVGLREAMIRGFPLVYLFGINPGKYVANWPVYIIGDDLASLRFKVAMDNLDYMTINPDSWSESDLERRRYITSSIKIRLHQRSFREKVIHAYRSQCAFCRLKHAELLDAAHIIPDTEPDSLPTIDNGMALCKIHHAAFDKYILGVTPDYIIKVRSDVLEETDGPMLQHGLIGLHDQQIILPRHLEWQPNKLFLDRRFEKFKKGA